MRCGVDRHEFILSKVKSRESCLARSTPRPIPISLKSQFSCLTRLPGNRQDWSCVFSLAHCKSYRHGVKLSAEKELGWPSSRSAG